MTDKNTDMDIENNKDNLLLSVTNDILYCIIELLPLIEIWFNVRIVCKKLNALVHNRKDKIFSNLCKDKNKKCFTLEPIPSHLILHKFLSEQKIVPTRTQLEALCIFLKNKNTIRYSYSQERRCGMSIFMCLLASLHTSQIRGYRVLIVKSNQRDRDTLRRVFSSIIMLPLKEHQPNPNKIFLDNNSTIEFSNLKSIDYKSTYNKVFIDDCAKYDSQILNNAIYKILNNPKLSIKDVFLFSTWRKENTHEWFMGDILRTFNYRINGVDKILLNCFENITYSPINKGPEVELIYKKN
jgi:hypothetical protein